MRRNSTVIVTLVATVLTLLSASSNAKTPSEKPAELTKIDQLKDAFNRDAGKTRLILLLSPT